MLETAALVAIVALGLPHGGLDLIELRQDPTVSVGSNAILLVYLALLTATGLLWLAAPPIALAVFLMISVGHFAAEWREHLPLPIALPAAGLLIAGPAAIHPQIVATLFGELARDAHVGQQLVDVLRLTAPPLVLILGCGLLLGAPEGHVGLSESAILLAITAAVVILPPLPAFALFFCLVHSPRHLAATASRLGLSLREAIARALPLTVLAVIGILMIWTAVGPRAYLPVPLFIALAVLTVPHMFTAPALRLLRSLLTG